MDQFLIGRMHTFEVAARCLSFTKTADKLFLTQGAISQQMRSLEDRLGYDLFVRKSRSLELTDAGEQLASVVRNSLKDIQDKIDFLNNANNSGVIKVCTGPSFALNRLIPMLGDFHSKHSEVSIQVTTSDIFDDILTQLNHADFIIRFGRQEHTDLVNIDVAQENIFVVCSPDLITGHKKLKHITDIGRFKLLRNEMSEREESGLGDWETWFKHFKHTDSSDLIDLGALYPRSDMLVKAAVHGHGLALAWDTMVSEQLKSGSLVKAFDGQYEVPNSYFVVSYKETAQRTKSRLFLDWLTSLEFREPLNK